MLTKSLTTAYEVW